MNNDRLAVKVWKWVTAALLLLGFVGNAHAQLYGYPISSSQIQLTWGGYADAFYYRYLMRWNGGSWDFIGSFSPAPSSYVDSGLATGTTYSYKLVLWDGGEGYPGETNIVSITTLAPPNGAPTGLGATAVSGTQINLAWSDTSSNETGFKIERKTGAGGAYGEIATVGADVTSYASTGLATGTTYYYRVRATNGAGDSGYSNEAGATTVAPPSAPSGLQGTPASATQINLSWTDGSNNETGFKLERKTGANGTYSQIAQPASNATSYSDIGLSATTAYYYRLRATNSAGDSAYSNEIVASTLTPPDGAPSALSAAPLGANEVRLVWTDGSSNETGFKIERKAGAGGTWAQIATAAMDATIYSDATVSAGTTYYYRLRATNSGGDSAYTNEATATTGPVANVTNGSVQYTYDAFGNLIQTNAGGVVTTLTYDIRGRKTAMSDADMGNWSYAYNALGELVSQTDAKGQTTTMAYDALGRMTSRTEADLVSTWTYDTCSMGVGKLCLASADNGYQRTHGYDSLGRPSTLTTTIDTAYTVTTAYDAAGRVQTLTYPGGFAVRNVYNSYGYLSEIRNNADDALFWQAQTMAAGGQVTQELLGNGLAAARTYDAMDRLLTQTATGSGGTAQSNTYTYDAIGNLASRIDATQNVTEYFYYDSLNRLLASSGPNLVSRSYEYDAIGNIVYKSDVGSYTYGTRPHAVASVAGAVNATYQYDANGNLISGAGRTLTYASFNLPLTVSQGTDAYQYTYNAEHERVRLVVNRASGTYTTIYLHPGGKGELLYEKETFPDGKIEYRHYVANVGAYVTRSAYGAGEGPGMRYFHRDHLGSVQVITNDAGAQLERLAYETFGKRRYPNGTADPGNLLFGVTTERGFTGHEHLDEMQLIHMNGRVFDPLLGRFVTADPIIDSPSDLQSYNRYSYVNNNPLAYTDPTGHLKLGRLIAAIAVAAVIGPEGFFGVTGITSSAAVSSVLAGAAAGVVMSGNMQGAVTGGLSGGLFYWAGGIGAPFSPERIAAHAFAGCVSSSAAGGSCESGAMSAGFAKFASQYIPSDWSHVAKLVTYTVIGGTASAIGGGKFENGAFTASFGYLFNHMASTGEASAAASLGTNAVDAPPVDERIQLAMNVDPSCPGGAGFLNACGGDGGGGGFGGWAGRAAGSLRGLGNITQAGSISPDVALNSGIRWLGSGYREIAPGVFRSSDGLRRFRMTNSDLTPTHGRIGPHVHFEALDAKGRVTENLHVPIR